MKTFKSFFLFTILALLLSSCVVKSLHAFYTNDILFYEQKLVGQWSDASKGTWNIQPFKEVILSENHVGGSGQLEAEQKRLLDLYNKGYVVNYKNDSTESVFLAMPFKIKNQLFLDFTPIQDKESEQGDNNLYRAHLINTHSLAKLDFDTNNKATIKWFDQDKLEALLNEDKIKIKYEKTGFDETILLTASSEELVKFIEKYMNSQDEDKWKTDFEFNLTR